MNDDGMINLRKVEKAFDEPEFKIKKDPVKMGPFASESTKLKAEAVSSNSAEPSDKIKVKFDKFVNLIATHAYEDVVEKHKNQDIIMSTDLLTDLANAFEENHDKKTPVTFMIAGLVIGVIITWLILKS
ncbi:hypothetical protein COU74_04335 [Candidatus Peregrinibacteria bacterium CG10_big_fil_rev_8_21_14_0_10_36_19]|nr:MAG: hypothetical protein COU74_04335 [Candidatus Peregrinibacteria bacterium CG10_big_fil_rev_8_21_14_0_10_36_19]